MMTHPIVNATDIPIGLSKVGLHCFRRGSVTKSVCSGANLDVVRKAMHKNVNHYARLGFNQLKVLSYLAY